MSSATPPPAPGAYPHPVSSKVGDAERSQMDEAIRRFGVTDGALCRMALQAFLPGYLAAQGRPEHTEVLAKTAAVLAEKPALKADLETWLRTAHRRAA